MVVSTVSDSYDVNTSLDTKNALSLSISLYIPSHTKDNTPIDSKFHADLIARIFTRMFNGATIKQALTGYYLHSNGHTQVEKPLIVQSYTKTLSESEKGILLDLCNDLKKLLNQDCIGLEIVKQNGGMLFI